MDQLASIEENELVVVVKTLSPSTTPEGDVIYDWTGVKIFLNGKEINAGKFELILDASISPGMMVKAPVMKINDFGDQTRFSNGSVPKEG